MLVLMTRILHSIDDLVSGHDPSEGLAPCIAYPKTPKGLVDYKLFTINNLDRLVDCAAKHLIEKGLMIVVGRVMSKPTPRKLISHSTRNV